jgi:hypothetical protein
VIALLYLVGSYAALMLLGSFLPAVWRDNLDESAHHDCRRPPPPASTSSHKATKAL